MSVRDDKIIKRMIESNMRMRKDTDNSDIEKMEFIDLSEDINKIDTKEKKKKRRTRKLKKNAKSILLIAAGIIVIIYIGFSIFFMNHFYFGTVINEENYSGYSPKNATSRIVKLIEQYELMIIGRDNLKDTIKGKDVALEYQFDDTLDRIAKEQNGWLWIVGLFQEHVYELPKTAIYNEEKLDEKINQLVFFKADNIVKPKNAHISEYSAENGYSIVEEVKGSTLKKKIITKAIKEAMGMVENELDLEKEDCYENPSVTKDSKELITLCDKLNACINVTITYDFDFTTETINKNQIQEWISFDKNRITFDDEKVREYVNGISKKYDTYGRNRKFVTVSGNELELLSGGYGWRVDRAAETEQLMEDIAAGKDIKRNMIYSYEGYVRKDNGEGGVDDIGDTYVEINLGAQHLYVFQNGDMVEESDFVSGKLSNGNGTPAGVFGITYKERNATLKGESYESHVNYWMPFNGNIGMHDATWRKEFGKQIYLTNGSHGCVNLPITKAEKIYDMIEKGMPVICYY